MVSKLRQKRGVTFLEIVFAVAILAVAMLPIIQMSRQGIKRTGFNIHRITATMLSNQLMERYRTMPFAWLDDKFGTGDVDLTSTLSSDPILASPALPKSYKKLLEKYTVTGSFQDVSGDESLGLLSFTVKWQADRKAAKSKLSLGKAVINYEKFGIRTVNTQGGFLQTGGASISSMNTDWNAPPPTNPTSTSSTSNPIVPTDTNTSASPTTYIPPNPFGAINNFG